VIRTFGDLGERLSDMFPVPRRRLDLLREALASDWRSGDATWRTFHSLVARWRPEYERRWHEERIHVAPRDLRLLVDRLCGVHPSLRLRSMFVREIFDHTPRVDGSFLVERTSWFHALSTLATFRCWETTDERESFFEHLAPRYAAGSLEHLAGSPHDDPDPPRELEPPECRVDGARVPLATAMRLRDAEVERIEIVRDGHVVDGPDELLFPDVSYAVELAVGPNVESLGRVPTELATTPLLDVSEPTSALLRRAPPRVPWCFAELPSGWVVCLASDAE